MAMLAILMPVMIGIAAFAINVVYMEMARTELQISLDVAARAAGRTLAVTEDESQASNAAENMLALNPYANQVLTPDETNIEFGFTTRYSDLHRYTFYPGSTPNAVKVEANGTNQVPMLFPSMGVNLQFRPIRAAICTQVNLDVALVIDRSTSMARDADEDQIVDDWENGDSAPGSSRWIDAVHAVDKFLHAMEESTHDERIALTTYASTPATDVELTDDYESIDDAMDDHSDSFGGGGSAIGDGIIDAVEALNHSSYARPWATRVLIVLSDGTQNTGVDAVEAAEQAAADNVMVYAISFTDDADQAMMQDVAAVAAGKHYHADDREQLKQVFEDIAHGFPTLITF
ncbi:von Willebrand factor type A domain protein [Stieleria neptunia]|uniref:von Willebrand factor type A domain protein n=1 Tax=Stieleria neptunia TaxID=2527979 RepID=A0A518HJ22_9BACT|nr:VWA domain-containing protein [Stieleria neptunia]QDV40790.1 von Willebrand factor type A domain protein [Stieleria neptunia]